jgi:magnesium-transporting ATPase (P-type)
MGSEQPVTEPRSIDVENGQEGVDVQDIPDTNVDVGLSISDVETLREKYGWNEIPAPSTPLYLLFVHQFTGFLAILIELAAIISLSVQDWTDFGIIVGILLVNGEHVNSLYGIHCAYMSRTYLLMSRGICECPC